MEYFNSKGILFEVEFHKLGTEFKDGIIRPSVWRNNPLVFKGNQINFNSIALNIII